MSSFKLKIITPTKILHNTNVTMVTAPGHEGEFGILSGHIPLLINLKTGYIKLYDKNETVTEKIFIPSGLCQVKQDNCTIFIEETINLEKVNAEEIDKEITDLKQKIAQDKLEDHSLLKLQSKVESLECTKEAASNIS